MVVVRRERVGVRRIAGATTVGATVTGTWSAQPGGKTVLLDPDSKGEADRTVEIVSGDSVKLGGATLQRQKS